MVLPMQCLTIFIKYNYLILKQLQLLNNKFTNFVKF